MDLAHFAEELGRPHATLENLVLLSSIDSTNAFGRRAVGRVEGEGHRLPPTLITALYQWAGRGRQGREWSSPPGLGVLATLVIPISPLDRLPVLPLVVAVALCESLNRIVGDRCRLKWPNDLLVDGRKIGGVLIEVMGGCREVATALIGFGINHGQRRRDLSTEKATSLRQECRRLPSLARTAAHLIVAVLEGSSSMANPRQAVERYVELSIHNIGESLRCRTSEGVVEGTFVGFDSRGFLRLATAAGEQLLTAGELDVY